MVKPTTYGSRLRDGARQIFVYGEPKNVRFESENSRGRALARASKIPSEYAYDLYSRLCRTANVLRLGFLSIA